MRPRELHVLWAPSGPVAAYFSAALAHAHAGTMLGVNVSTCPLHERLPDHVSDDISSEDEHDDGDTPIEGVPFTVPIKDLDG